MTELIGRSLGKYQIVSRVGRGGMARIYKAYQPSLDRYVAIKLLHSHLADDPDFVERFEREATAVAKLRHPNIVQVIDYDVQDDFYFIVMEFIEGPTLKAEISERLKRRTETNRNLFDLDDIARIITALADAIDFAHTRGMIHRDIKPGNIMFTDDGQILLTDFGLARLVFTSRQSQTGALSGTPAYMAPEQVKGDHVDERADVYSLGIILYEMLTGRVPFIADSPYATMTMHVTEEVPDLAQFNSDVPKTIELVVMQALRKEPDDRYQSAGDLASALQDASGVHLVPSPLGSVVAPIATLADSQEMMPISTHVGISITHLAALTSPYRGLYAFREEDAPYFFGRESFTDRLFATVAKQDMAAVIGPSGSGKSSVVYAGLIPRLRESENKHWTIIEMRPGGQPFQALAHSLADLLVPAGTETALLIESRQLADALESNQVRLSDVLARIERQQNGNDRQLLFVDQFEELYTLCTNEDTRHKFPTTLFDAITDARERGDINITLVLTLRADFMGQALTDRPFADALQEADVKLGPMTRAELARAIESPAAKKRVVFEAGLVERILDDVGDEPGNLPLLEFALTLLWDRRSGLRMTHNAYEAIGRVEGSLARYADEIYEQLNPDEQRSGRRIFTQMVRPGEGTEDTRRLATREELGEEDWTLARRLADARLVVTGRTVSGVETVEVVHEALIRGWGRLREWMNSERAFRSWQERLRVAMHQWENSERDLGALLRGAPLAEARDWLQQKQRDLSQAEQEFIQASIGQQLQFEAELEAQRKRELDSAHALAEEQHRRAELEFRRAEDQARSTRNLRFLAVILGAVFILAVGAAVVAVGQSRDAAQQADARATEVVIRSIAEAQAKESANLAVTRAAESAAAQKLAESEGQRANEAAEEALSAKNEAELERDRADEQAQLALARQLAAQSAVQLGPQLDLALLLAVEADNLNTVPETASSLLSAIQFNPNLVTHLRGHNGILQSVDFSPDGNYLATAGASGEIFLWDLTSRNVIRQYVGHEQDQLVNRIEFSADGTKLASAGDDSIVILWDVESGEVDARLLGHTAWVQSVDFSPDGRFILSGSGDREAILWDVATGNIVQRYSGHGAALWDAVISNQGDLIATASADGTAGIWDVESGERIHTLTGHTAAVFNVAFSPEDDVLVSAGGDGNLIKWDVRSGEQIGDPLTGHNAGVADVAFSPDGSTLASSGGDSTVRLWDFESGQQIQLFGNHNGLVPSVAFNENGSLLASGDVNGVAIIWKTDPVIQPLSFAFIQNNVGITDLAIHPDGQLLLGAGQDGRVYQWDINSGLNLSEVITHGLRIDEPVISAQFDVTGDLLATGSQNGTVHIWDLSSQNILLSLSALSNGVRSLVFDSENQLLYTGGTNGFTALWNSQDGTQVGPFLSGHRGEVNSVAISPNGQYIASAGSDGTLIIREISELQGGQAAGAPVSPMSYSYDEDTSIIRILFSPESATLISGDNKGMLVLWDAEEQVPLSQLVIEEGDPITDLHFGLDGEQLIVSTEGGKIWLIDGRLESMPEMLHEISTGRVQDIFWNVQDNILLVLDKLGHVYEFNLSNMDMNRMNFELPYEDPGFAVLGENIYFSNDNEMGRKFGVLDIQTGEMLIENRSHEQPFVGNVNDVAFSPDGKYFASAGNDGAVVIWDAISLQPSWQPYLDHTAPVSSLAFSPDGRYLASGSCDQFNSSGNCSQGKIVVRELERDTIVATLTDTVGGVQALVFSPDNRILVANDCEQVEVAGVCIEGSLQIYDVNTWKPERTLAGHTAFVWNAAFSPDGTVLASASADNTIILWDVATGQSVGQRLSNHGGPVRRVAFAPDGTLLASAGFDNLVYLWDVMTGQALGGPISSYTNNAFGLEFSPDGHKLTSSSLDGSVVVSEISLEYWREEACSIANRNLRLSEWRLFFGDMPYRETCIFD